MATIKNIATSEDYKKLAQAARDENENNDCTVKAVAAATGAPYKEVHAILKKLGRKTGRGTSLYNMRSALLELGFEYGKVTPLEMIATYKKSTKVTNVTTHHPDRFPRSAFATGTWILFTTGYTHTLCVKDGANHDHTRGRALRVVEIWQILPVKR